MLLRIVPQPPLEELAPAVEAREHRAKRSAEEVGDLLRVVALAVDEDEGHAVALGQACEHRADVLRSELLQEVEVKRIRVGERILVGDLAVEGELLQLAELYLLRAAGTRTRAVAAAVDEDRGQPGRAGGLVLEPVVPAMCLEKRVLH